MYVVHYIETSGGMTTKKCSIFDTFYVSLPNGLVECSEIQVLEPCGRSPRNDISFLNMMLGSRIQHHFVS